MSDRNTHLPRLPAAPLQAVLSWLRLDVWSVGAVLIAAVVLAPMVAVVWIAFHPVENIWPHMLATVLPRYFTTTLVLMAGVGVLTAVVGTAAA